MNASQNIDHRACNLCGAKKQRPKYTVDGFHIVECVDCSLCFVAEEVTSEVLEEYYDKNYYQDGQYSDYLSMGESRRSHYRAMLPSLRRHLPNEPINALDVGCATGYFLDVAKSAGWENQGVELSRFGAEAARERGHKVTIGNFAEVEVECTDLNLITMWDLIEHLGDPASALQKANRLMRPGGILVIATGDIQGVTARIYKSKWALLAPPGHLFYFSKKTLTEMLKRSGFEPIEWQSDGTFLVNQSGRPGCLAAGLETIHRLRYVNAILRRLHLGSVLTVYARKCGNY